MTSVRVLACLLCVLVLAACSRDTPAPAAEPATDPAAAAAREQALQAQLEARRVFAQGCVDEVIRDQHAELARASSLLVFVASASCGSGSGCDTPRIAVRTAREHAVDGLRVLLIRAADAPTAGPLEGVATVTLPRCAAVAAPHADDFFVVDGQGRATSGGERNAAALRDGHVPAGSLDPAGALRAVLH